MAGRSAADADGVVALRLEIEQRVERGDAVNARQRNVQLAGDVSQRFRRKIFVRIVLLYRFQDAEQFARTASVSGDDLVDERLFGAVEKSRQ